MLQIKTVIKAGKPVFELRSYSENFKTSYLVIQLPTYEKAISAKEYLDNCQLELFDEVQPVGEDVPPVSKGGKRGS